MFPYCWMGNNWLLASGVFSMETEVSRKPLITVSGIMDPLSSSTRSRFGLNEGI